jgi:hypothetical protein
VGVRQQNLVDDVPVGVVEEDEAQQQEEVCLEAEDATHFGVEW